MGTCWGGPPSASYYWAVIIESRNTEKLFLEINFDGWVAMHGLGLASKDIYFEITHQGMEPPNIPSTPSGETSGFVGSSYYYSTSTTDPNGEWVRYEFDWGDDSTTTTLFIPSGVTITRGHTWDSAGIYNVRVRAQDYWGWYSDWSSPLAVNMRNPQLSISTTSGGTTDPAPGTHSYSYGESVTVTDSANTYYAFDYWKLDGETKSGNPITVTMNSDHSLKAYFEYVGGGGGGGEICPTLFVWNGADYVDYGVIDIHGEEDVIREVSIQGEDVATNKHKAVFRLREGWEGLNFSESVIDQVKLYAVDDDGNLHLCPLVEAEHSTLGNVLPQLLASDDTKAQTLLLETIDLEFVATHQNVQGFTFVVEGCNILKY